MDLSLIVFSAIGGLFILMAFYMAKVFKSDGSDEQQAAAGGDAAETKNDNSKTKQQVIKSNIYTSWFFINALPGF